MRWLRGWRRNPGRAERRWQQDLGRQYGESFFPRELLPSSEPLAVRRLNQLSQALAHRLEYRDGKFRISLEGILEISPG